MNVDEIWVYEKALCGGRQIYGALDLMMEQIPYKCYLTIYWHKDLLKKMLALFDESWLFVSTHCPVILLVIPIGIL